MNNLLHDPPHRAPPAHREFPLMKSRSLNLIILVAVLIISALAARYWIRPGSLQADLKTSLDRFWNDPRSEVEITPTGEARIRLWIPSGLRPRQQQWTFPVARWVAARHPETKVSNWSVTDVANGRPLIETPSLDSKGGQRGTIALFQEPNYFEAARSQLLQEHGQRQLDRQLGARRALMLVDVQSQTVSWLPNLGNNPQQTYGKRPESESQFAFRRTGGNPRGPHLRVHKIEACLVVSSQADAEDAQKVLQVEIEGVRCDRLRTVIL